MSSLIGRRLATPLVLLWEQEAADSNPAIPTTTIPTRSELTSTWPNVCLGQADQVRVMMRAWPCSLQAGPLTGRAPQPALRQWRVLAPTAAGTTLPRWPGSVFVCCRCYAGAVSACANVGSCSGGILDWPVRRGPTADGRSGWRAVRAPRTSRPTAQGRQPPVPSLRLPAHRFDMQNAARGDVSAGFTLPPSY
jgi:hypothetical protein